MRASDEESEVRCVRLPADRAAYNRAAASVLLVAGSVVVGLPFFALLALILPVAVLARKLAARPGQPLPVGDVAWMEDVAVGALFVDRGLGLATLRDLFRRRITDRRLENGQLAYPRFSQRVLPTCGGGWTLIPDPNFSIDNHVIQEPAPVPSRRRLQSLVQSLGVEKLRGDRPPWELRLVPAYCKGQEAVLLFRAHHALGDGATLLHLLGAALADEPCIIRLGPRTLSRLEAFRSIVQGPLMLLYQLIRPRQEERPPFPKERGGPRRMAWTSDIRGSDVRRIKQVTRASVSDVLLSAVAGSLRSHFQRSGLLIPPTVTASVPVDLHRGDGTPTRWTVVGVELPTGTEGRVPRLWDVRAAREQARGSGLRTLAASRVLSALLPRRSAVALLDRFWPRQASAPLAFFGLAGPPAPLALSACPLRRLLVWVRPAPCPPVCFTVVSYAGAFHVTLSVDAAVVPSPRTLLADLRLQIIKLTNHLAKRKEKPILPKRPNHCHLPKDGRPSVKEIHQRLERVQAELHHLARSLDHCCPATGPTTTETSARAGLYRRMATLRREFSDLLLLLHGSPDTPVEDEEDEEENECVEETALYSMRSEGSRRGGFASFLSTARPLTAPQWGATPEHRRCLLRDQTSLQKGETQLSEVV